MTSIRDIWVFAHSITRSARKIINLELKPLNLSSTQGNILFHLLVRNTETTQEQLVEELDIGKAAISRAIDVLEQKGYVHRNKHPLDKRTRLVSLTDKARAIGSDIERVYSHIFDIARKGIPDKEYEKVVQLMSLISENFSKLQPKRG